MQKNDDFCVQLFNFRTFNRQFMEGVQKEKSYSQLGKVITQKKHMPKIKLGGRAVSKSGKGE